MPPISRASRIREVWPVAAFTAGYMLLAIAAAITQRNVEFVFYIGVMVVLIGVVVLVDSRVRLSDGALWGLSLWGFLHMGGGLVPVPDSWPVNEAQQVLYSLWLIPGRLKFDQLVHAFGFGVTTWVCWQGMAAAFRTRGVEARPTTGVLILCAAAGMGFGALNEVIEFAATLLVPETNVGGYLNTGWDLVANLVGASLAVILIRSQGPT